MQKKINTEFTRASDEKCTSESVPPDKWQDEHMNNDNEYRYQGFP